jgi:hypothetical protein
MAEAEAHRGFCEHPWDDGADEESQTQGEGSGGEANPGGALQAGVSGEQPDRQHGQDVLDGDGPGRPAVIIRCDGAPAHAHCQRARFGWEQADAHQQAGGQEPQSDAQRGDERQGHDWRVGKHDANAEHQQQRRDREPPHAAEDEADHRRGGSGCLRLRRGAEGVIRGVVRAPHGVE